MQNQSEPNPYRSPGPMEERSTPIVDLGEPIETLEVVDLLGKRKSWTVSVFADRLRFAAQDELSHEVLRDELSQTTTLYDSWLIRRSLEVRGKKKRLFQFSPEGFEILNDWIGPPTSIDLVTTLKKRFSYVLPIAILFVLTSLPISGDAKAGIEPLPFDAESCLLGLSLFLVAGASKIFPHRIFLLLDSLWFIVLAATLIYDIAIGASWLWIILVVFQIQLIVIGVKQYLRFSAIEPEVVSVTKQQSQGSA